MGVVSGIDERAAKEKEAHISFRELPEESDSPARLAMARQRPAEVRRTPSFREAGEISKSPFIGSVTLQMSVARLPERSIGHPFRSRTFDLGATSMSSAPVETLSMHGKVSELEAGASRACGALYRLCPERGRLSVPFDVLLFLIMLGIITGLTCIAVDVAIINLHDGRRFLLNQTAVAFGPEGGCESVASAASCYFLRMLIWICFALVFVWASILLTGFLSPLAYGSGIPEMKSCVVLHVACCVHDCLA